MQKENKVVRLSFAGGLIGLLAGSSRGRLERVLAEHNVKGWSLAEVVPDSPNLLIWVLRVFFLVVTLGLWTLSNGYLLVLERPKGFNSQADIAGNGRKEPPLTAAR